MKFLAIIYNDESLYADATPEQIAATFEAHGEFGQAAGEAGVFVGGEGLQPIGDRDDRPRARRRAHAHRRSVRRDQGAARRLLPARVQGPRRGAQLGGADPGGQDRRDRGPPDHGLRRARGPGGAAPRPRPDTALRTSSSTACSGASRDRRSPSSPASSATSIAPRRRSRTPSWSRSSAGRATACRTTRRPGSSPRRATGRSTGSAPRGAGRGGAARSRPSCARSAATRKPTRSWCARSPTSGCG